MYLEILNNVPEKYSSSYINSPKEKAMLYFFTCYFSSPHSACFYSTLGLLLLYLFSVIAMLTSHYIIYFFIFKKANCISSSIHLLACSERGA